MQECQSRNSNPGGTRLSILDEQRDGEPELGLREAANSTEEPFQVMQDIAPLQSMKVHLFIKNWGQVGKG